MTSSYTPVDIISHLTAQGVITASSGNHGQGLSLAALRSGIRATIVLPKAAPTNKVEEIKGNSR